MQSVTFIAATLHQIHASDQVIARVPFPSEVSVMARVTARMESTPRISITSDRHTWYADEPVALGGTDQGPTPYELLLGSLAACTVLTVRLYANHKGIPLDSITANYEFSRAKNDAGVQEERIVSSVTLGGTFDESQRARLAQIVGRCAVHKTLAQGLTIVDNVAFVDGVELPEAQTAW
jgi:putative redox protein